MPQVLKPADLLPETAPDQEAHLDRLGLVWAFFRTGDKAALVVSLGPVPAYEQADELLAHLESLVARSVAFNPSHLASLLPRLLAECAIPQPLDRLKAACSRAQDRWEHQVAEL